MRSPQVQRLSDKHVESTEAFQNAALAMAAWRNDPCAFVRSEFRAEPDPWQIEVLNDFRDEQRLALVACKGPGKTAVLAWCIWNFALTRPYPKIACTAITGENLRDNLWSELAKWGKRSKIIRNAFEFGKERINYRYDSANWFIAARRWARDSDSEAQEMTLAGLHAEHLLFVIDEAGGVPDAVAAAAEGGLATGKETKLVIAGNPTHLEGPLYRAVTKERNLWKVHFVSADPERRDRAPRVSKVWAEQMALKWGRDSAWYQCNVLGKFPKGATEGLIPLGVVEEAYNRKTSGDGNPMRDAPRVLGADIARFGPDWNRVCFRAGDVLEKFEGWKGQDTVETANRIAAYYKGYEAETVYVDDIGIGGGVVDQLAAMGVPVIGVNVGEAAEDKEHYFNLRAELAGRFRDLFRSGDISLTDEVREDSTLAADCSTIRTLFTHKQQMRLEPKENFRKRNHRSPDFLDAAVLAFSVDSGPSVCAFAEDTTGERAEWDAETHADRQQAAMISEHTGTFLSNNHGRERLCPR